MRSFDARSNADTQVRKLENVGVECVVLVTFAIQTPTVSRMLWCGHENYPTHFWICMKTRVFPRKVSYVCKIFMKMSVMPD